MAAAGLALLLLGFVSGCAADAERGRMELRRVQSLAVSSAYGECWARALEHLDTRCKELTSDKQSRIALRFTMCHLSSSGRDFPSCPEGGEVSRCTAAMDAVAFNAFTEFFTHTHSICQYLQTEAWHSRAESTMFRLADSSAAVAEQLLSTRLLAEDLIEAQSAALQTQQDILHNGQQLKKSLTDSTHGLQAVFSALSEASSQQQAVLSSLFSRVSFLHNFLLTEAHDLTSCCYNAAALCCCFLLTCTPRTSRARLLLLSLVCVNFYLERRIYQHVIHSDHPEHTHMELVSVYVCVLRRLMVCVAVCVLVCVCVCYRDPLQQSLHILQQLRDTQKSLQEALQRAERLSGRRDRKQLDDPVMSQKVTSCLSDQSDRFQRSRGRAEHEEEEKKEEEEEEERWGETVVTHNASGRPHTPPSPLVYSILVEDTPCRYRLRSRRLDVR